MTPDIKLKIENMNCTVTSMTMTTSRDGSSHGTVEFILASHIDEGWDDEENK